MNGMSDRQDFEELINLAASRGIRVVEAQDLRENDGCRFNNSEGEWIAVNSDLKIAEKIRTLGFLLENFPRTIENESLLFSLQCPRT